MVVACGANTSSIPTAPRPRGHVKPAAAAGRHTAGAGGSSSAEDSVRATPLPLLPFWHEFRSQVARLEGVQALPVPSHLAASQSTQPAPVGIRYGSCHSDRLRFGHFLYVAAGSSSLRRRGRASSQGSHSNHGSLSLLQGTLFPSCFSFHPPLAFMVAAFDGGDSWVVSVDYCATLLPQQGQVQQQRQEWQQQSGTTTSSSSSSGRWDTAGAGAGAVEAAMAGLVGSGRQASSNPAGPRGADETEVMTVEGWQQQQFARLEAVRRQYSRGAVPLPPVLASLQSAAATATWPSSAHCLLSSAQLLGLDPSDRQAALESVGLPAFRAALSAHLNGLAMAPADASHQHLQRTAAAQQQYLRATVQQPLLCTAQLVSAFGRPWTRQLQEHLLTSSQRGLTEILEQTAAAAAAMSEPTAAAAAAGGGTQLAVGGGSRQQAAAEASAGVAATAVAAAASAGGSGRHMHVAGGKPAPGSRQAEVPPEFVYFDPSVLMQQAADEGEE